MSKFSAKGWIAKVALTATPTNALGQMKTIGLNHGARKLVDVTTHDSSVTMDYIDSGLRDTPEIEINLEWDPDNTQHELIRAAHAAGTPVYMTVVAPNTGAAQWACLGIVTEASAPAKGPDGDLEWSFKYKATSAETFTQ